MLKILSTFFISLFILIGCGDSKQEDSTAALWTANTYTTEVDDRTIKLILHPIADTVDILQADILIQETDSTGPVFEALNSKIETIEEQLRFEWEDGFGNKGRGQLKPLSDNQQTVLLTLEADEIVSDRNMMFIDSYELKIDESD